MNAIQILPPFVGAALGGFFGYYLQSRNQKIERNGIYNLLVGFASSAHTTLTHMRLQIELNVTSKGDISTVNYVAITPSEKFTVIHDIQRNLNLFTKLRGEDLGLALKLIYECVSIESRVNSVNDSIKLVENDTKRWFYFFGLNWNAYIDSIDKIIRICENLIDKSPDMVLTDKNIYDKLKLYNLKNRGSKKLDIDSLPDDFARL